MKYELEFHYFVWFSLQILRLLHWKRWSCFVHLSKNLEQQESMLGEELLFMATNTLVLVCKLYTNVFNHFGICNRVNVSSGNIGRKFWVFNDKINAHILSNLISAGFFCLIWKQLFWRTKNFGYLWEAILVLEFGLHIRRLD